MARSKILRRPSVLLPKVSAFRNDLVEYCNLLRRGDREAAAPLRVDLSIRWGELMPDLHELGVTRHYQQFGRTFPIFETALQPSTDDNHSSLKMAISAIEPAIGQLRRMVEEGSPSHRSFRLAAFVLVFVAGWLLRHYQDRILLLHLPSAATWTNTKVGLLAMAVCVSGISSNILTGIVQDGWLPGIKREPLRFFLYLAMTLGLAIYAAIAATR